MNDNLNNEIFCLIREIESVSSNNNSEYLKNESQIDEKIMNEVYNFMDKKVSPWIFDLTEGNEIGEIKNNILTDVSKIHSYLYSFEIYFDNYFEIVFDELKKYYIDNSIQYNEDQLREQILDDIQDKKINLKIFSKDTKKLINILFLINIVEDKLSKLLKSM